MLVVGDVHACWWLEMCMHACSCGGLGAQWWGAFGIYGGSRGCQVQVCSVYTHSSCKNGQLALDLEMKKVTDCVSSITLEPPRSSLRTKKMVTETTSLRTTCLAVGAGLVQALNSISSMVTVAKEGLY